MGLRGCVLCRACQNSSTVVSKLSTVLGEFVLFFRLTIYLRLIASFQRITWRVRGIYRDYGVYRVYRNYRV